MIIAQLSDPHVCAPGVLYKGVADSNQALCDAIAHLHALDSPPDLVVITGDLTADGLAEEYAQARKVLAHLRCPYLVMPGNHDLRAPLRAAFPEHSYLGTRGPCHYAIEHYPVRIIALDACRDHEHKGALEQADLTWLENALRAGGDTPCLLMMHHPPFVSGIPYLDDYRFFDDGQLARLVARFPSVAAVLVGHVHRLMVHRWAGTVVCSCPSTTTQIALRLNANAKPQSYIGPAGCLVHSWSAEHGLVSHLSHIGNYAGPYNFF
jgi:3',5'-cyclic-AMP phosphodiesterase